MPFILHSRHRCAFDASSLFTRRVSTNFAGHWQRPTRRGTTLGGIAEGVGDCMRDARVNLKKPFVLHCKARNCTLSEDLLPPEPVPRLGSATSHRSTYRCLSFCILGSDVPSMPVLFSPGVSPRTSQDTGQDPPDVAQRWAALLKA